MDTARLAFKLAKAYARIGARGLGHRYLRRAIRARSAHHRLLADAAKWNATQAGIDYPV